MIAEILRTGELPHADEDAHLFVKRELRDYLVRQRVRIHPGSSEWLSMQATAKQVQHSLLLMRA
jgi:hypothetical protein